MPSTKRALRARARARHAAPLRGVVQGLLIVALACLAGIGCAKPVLRAYETPYFTVYADLIESQQRSLARDIEFAASSARFMTGIDFTPAPRPVELLLTGDLRDPWQYVESREQRFAFHESPHGAYYLLDGRSPLRRQRTQLELALLHHALRSAPDVAPLWFSVGFEAFLETLDIRGDSVIVGALDTDRLEAFRGVEPILIDIALQPGRITSLSPARRRGYDAVAWLMVHALMLESGAASAHPPVVRFRLYTHALEQGQDASEALEYAWGITPLALKHRIEALARTGVTVRRFDYATIVPEPMPIERRAVPPAEAARLRGRLRAAFGDSERARAQLLEAIRLAPDQGLARAELARLESSLGRHTEARQLAEDACLLAPHDPQALLTRAVVAMAEREAPGFETQRPALARSAHDDLERARTLAPHDPEILLTLGRLRLRAPKRSGEEATEPLEAALALLPSDRQIRLSLLEAYTRSGDARAARRVAASLRTDAPDAALVERIDELMTRLGATHPPPWREP